MTLRTTFATERMVFNFSKISVYLSLTKPRLTILALFTTLVGFYLSTPGQVDLLLLFHVLFATALVAAGAGALNMVIEKESDALMERTKYRPIPSGRLTSGESLLFGIIIAVTGILYAGLLINILTMFLEVVTITSYLLIYTPLKKKTPLCTIFGAIPGAIPPVIGWVSVRNAIGIEALSLFVILFVWQIPHFLAIASMYKEDYKKASFPMLPVIDKTLYVTSFQIILYCMTLIPISLLPALIGFTGAKYFIAALVAGFVLLFNGILFMQRKTLHAGRWLFISSIIYLPVLLLFMMIDKIRLI